METEMLKYDSGLVKSSEVLKKIVLNLTHVAKQQIPRQFNIEQGQQRVSLIDYLPKYTTTVEYAKIYMQIHHDTDYNRWRVSYATQEPERVVIEGKQVRGAKLFIDGKLATINLETLLEGGKSFEDAYIEGAIEQLKQQFPDLQIERSYSYFQYPTVEIADPTGVLTKIEQEYEWDSVQVTEYQDINLQGPMEFVVRYDNSFLFGGDLDHLLSVPAETNSPIEFYQFATSGRRRDDHKIYIGEKSRVGLLPYKFLAEFEVEHTTSSGTAIISPSKYRFSFLSGNIVFNNAPLMQYGDQIKVINCRTFDLPKNLVNDERIFDRENKYVYNPQSHYVGEAFYDVWRLYWTKWRLIYPTNIDNLTNKAIIQSPEIFVEIRDNGDNLEVSYGATLNATKDGLDENASSPFVKIDKGEDNPLRFHMNWSGDFFNILLNHNYLYCGRLGGSKQYALTGTCADFTPNQKWGQNSGNGQNDIIAGKWFQAHYPKTFVLPDKFKNATAVNPNSKEFISPVYVYDDYDKTIGYLQGIMGGHINFGPEGTKYIVDKPEIDATGLPLHPLTKTPLFRGQLYEPPPEKEYIQQPIKANNTLFDSLPNNNLTVLFRTK